MFPRYSADKVPSLAPVQTFRVSSPPLGATIKIRSRTHALPVSFFPFFHHQLGCFHPTSSYAGGNNSTYGGSVKLAAR